MLEAQRTYLDSLISDTNAYLDKLVEQNTHEQSLIDKSREYSAFCNERILWIRSSSPRPLTDPGRRPRLRWLFGPRHWLAVVEMLQTDIADNAVAAGLFALWGARWPSATRARGSDAAGRSRVPRNAPGHRAHDPALFLTVFLASPRPALMAVLGGRLMLAGAGDPFAHALGKGCCTPRAVLWTGAPPADQPAERGRGTPTSAGLDQPQAGPPGVLLVDDDRPAAGGGDPDHRVPARRSDQATPLGRMTFVVAVHAMLLLPAYRITRLGGSPVSDISAGSGNVVDAASAGCGGAASVAGAAVPRRAGGPRGTTEHVGPARRPDAVHGRPLHGARGCHSRSS